MNAARRIALVAALAALTGCAGVPVQEAPKKFRPLSSYASDPYVPINLYLNSNEQASGTLAVVIQHSADQLRDSGAFVRVDQGVQRWPITLQARYQLRENSAEGDVTRRILGLLTLGLMPVRVSQTHTLFAEVLAEPDSIAAMEFSVTVRDRVSVYDLADPARGERAAADVLLEQLLSEITQRKLIPRWSSFRPEPKPKPRPKAPEGQPT